jgi:hypothetical protein
MLLRNLTAGAVIAVTVLALSCGEVDTPFEVGVRTPTPRATAETTTPGQQGDQGSVPGSTDQSTDAPEQTSGPQPPPKNELIKFANWDDNPVKLVNWIAGYIVAHGLDRPVRIVEVEDGAYQGPLQQNDVDIVFAADRGWADEQVNAGVAILLGNGSPTDSALAIVVHPSMLERAPDVIELLEKFVIDSDLLAEQSARIHGGRVGLKENAVSLDILKKSPEIWTPWVHPDTATAVTKAIEDGKIGHCREFVNYAPDRQGNEGSRYCKDDPTKTSGNR